MRNILVLGAGQSSSALIRYLLANAPDNNWKLTVADNVQTRLSQNFLQNPACNNVLLDILDIESRNNLIKSADLVISMLPYRFHPLVLEGCIRYKKHLITPSYQSKEMKIMEPEINMAGILVLNEMGLDPGIDHMSAMQVIDQIKAKGYRMTCFESFTGGLMAPGYENNEWQYKFSWNPQNVVLAGQGGTVRFLHNGKYKYIPYGRIFRRTERISIEDYGNFEGYANRDSLHYIDKYNLQGIATIYRGTLRRPGFCRAWDIFVQLGATDNSFIMEGSENMTYREFINSFLPYNPHDSVELKLMHYLRLDQDSGMMQKLSSLDMFSNKIIGIKDATPAQILEHILREKWTMSASDKDMVVMWHKFFYDKAEVEAFHQTSALVVIGDDGYQTAMARTVGLPIGVAAKLILNGKITLKGLHIPVVREIYHPVLQELEKQGIVFKNNVTPQTSCYDEQPIF